MKRVARKVAVKTTKVVAKKVLRAGAKGFVSKMRDQGPSMAQIRDRNIREKDAPSGGSAGSQYAQSAQGSEICPSLDFSSRALTLNVTNLNRVINSIIQAYISSMNAIGVPDDTATLLGNAAQGMYTDLLGACNGTVSRYKNVPVFYKELFDAISPKQKPIGRIKYTTTSKSANPFYVEVDSYHIGPLAYNAYTTSGLAIVQPLTISPDSGEWDSAVSIVFKAFGAQGHLMCDTTSTTTLYATDVSAYAQLVYKTGTDYSNAYGMAQLEMPITCVWAAALGIFSDDTLDENRVPNYIVPLYAPPGTYFGNRIITFLTGAQGKYDQVRLTRMDCTDLWVLGCGYTDGAIKAWESENVGVGGNPFLDPSVNQMSLFLIYTQMLLQNYFLPFSPAYCGCVDSTGLYTSMPWGAQFFANDMATYSSWKYGNMVVENLRMLRPYTRKIRGVVTAFYPVPCYANKLFGRYRIQGFVPLGDPGDVWSSSYDFSNSTDGRVVSLIPSVINGSDNNILAYISSLNSLAVGTQKNMRYETFAITSNAIKKTTLAHFTRLIFVPLRERRNSLTIQGRPTMMKGIENFRTVLASGNKLRYPATAAGSISGEVTDGAPLAIMCDRPIFSSYTVFLALALPIALIEGSNFNNFDLMIAKPYDRLNAYALQHTMSIGIPYKDAIYTTGQASAQTQFLDSANNELMQALHNDDNMGLGGAVGSGIGWLLTKTLGPKIGKMGKDVTNRLVDKYRDRL